MSENAFESPSAVTAQKGRIIVRLLTVLTCALMGCGVWYQLFRDEKPLLANEPIEEAVVPGADKGNGLIMLAEAVRELHLPFSNAGQFDILQRNAPWNSGSMKSLLEPAAELREAVENALRQPLWQEDNYQLETVSSLRLRNASEIFAAKALELEAAGELLNAVDWLSLAQALTARCSLKNVDLYHHMQCASAFRIVRKTLISMAARHQTERDLVKSALDLIQQSAMDFEELRHGVGLSAGNVLDELEEWKAKPNAEPPAVAKLREISATKLPVWFLSSRYKPGATQKLLRSWIEELESIGFREGRENRNAVLSFQARIDSELKASPLSFDPNRAGRILAASAFQRTLGLENGYFVVQEAERRCQTVVLAAKLYALDHGGARPNSLDKLVPQYLEKIPLDPYDGQPVRWVPATGMAYVSGDDGQADIPKLSSKTFSSPERNGAWAQLP